MRNYLYESVKSVENKKLKTYHKAYIRDKAA